MDATMSRGRLAYVYLVMAILLGGSLAHALAGKERWPFCAYKMFAGVRTQRSFTCLRVYGVVDGPRPVEMPLLADRYLAPFDQSRLWRSLMRVRKSKQAATRLPAALTDLLARYERRRAAGLHHGPPLTALRLYETTWQLDPWARNVDQPDTKVLIAEVARPPT